MLAEARCRQGKSFHYYSIIIFFIIFLFHLLKLTVRRTVGQSLDHNYVVYTSMKGL